MAVKRLRLAFFGVFFGVLLLASQVLTVRGADLTPKLVGGRIYPSGYTGTSSYSTPSDGQISFWVDQRVFNPNRALWLLYLEGSYEPGYTYSFDLSIRSSGSAAVSWYGLRQSTSTSNNGSVPDYYLLSEDKVAQTNTVKFVFRPERSVKYVMPVFYELGVQGTGDKYYEIFDVTISASYDPDANYYNQLILQEQKKTNNHLTDIDQSITDASDQQHRDMQNVQGAIENQTQDELDTASGIADDTQGEVDDAAESVLDDVDIDSWDALITQLFNAVTTTETDISDFKFPAGSVFGYDLWEEQPIPIASVLQQDWIIKLIGVVKWITSLSVIIYVIAIIRGLWGRITGMNHDPDPLTTDAADREANAEMMSQGYIM